MLSTGGIDSFTALNPRQGSDSRAKGVEDMDLWIFWRWLWCRWRTKIRHSLWISWRL